jgi:hypothetical protein
MTEKRMNKKAQDLSIGTLILIVLGIIVLVLLILGFSMGWDNLWNKINVFGGGASVGDVATRCKTDVTTNNKYSYCQKFEKVKIDNKIEYVTCEDDRVKISLESKLDCGTNTFVNDKCLALMKSGEAKEDTKVNSKLCWSAFADCTALGSTADISNKDGTCQNEKIKIQINSNNYCCVPK